ncbi:MAG: hypothetical protein WCH75_06455 [Candidatus Binatia bacterium]
MQRNVIILDYHGYAGLWNEHNGSWNTSVSLDTLLDRSAETDIDRKAILQSSIQTAVRRSLARPTVLSTT